MRRDQLEHAHVLLIGLQNTIEKSGLSLDMRSFKARVTEAVDVFSFAMQSDEMPVVNKTRSIIHISGNDRSHLAVCEDGTIWERFGPYGTWVKVEAIPTDEALAEKPVPMHLADATTGVRA